MAKTRKYGRPDEDIREISAEDFRRTGPARKAVPKVVAAMMHAGRPKLDRPKEHVTWRPDAAVVDAFKVQGPGWQSRINDALARLVAIGRQKAA